MNENIQFEATNIQTIIGAIWKTVFDEDHDIGLDEDFYDLGGNSLLSNEIKIAVKDTLGLEIEAGDVYEYPTIRSLTDYIIQKHNDLNDSKM